jgi:hypothetical protein
MPWVTPRTFLNGDVMTAAIMNQEVRDNLGFLGNTGTLAGWLPFVPTWRASSGTAPSLGNATVDCAWGRVGPTVFVRYHILSGSTTTYGSGSNTWYWGVPVHRGPLSLNYGAAEVVHFARPGVINYMGLMRFNGLTEFEVLFKDTAATLTQRVGTSIPFVPWQTGDRLVNVCFSYEVA